MKTTSRGWARESPQASEFGAIAAAHDRCFWLDGVATRPWSGHRSILGWLTDQDVSLSFSAARGEVTRHVGERSEVVGHDIFTALRDAVADDATDGQDTIWVGWFGYACRPDLPARTGDDEMPDAVWMRARHTQVITHEPGDADGPAVTTPPPSGRPVVPPGYAAAFDQVQESLHAGDSYEVNLTHRRTVSSPAEPVATYLRLRELNPAPYAGFLQHRGSWLLSASPERYATVDADGVLETRPIKGTTPRGSTPELDEQSRRHLASDPKFRAENLMIVDLLRNDVGMVCEAGTVEVPQLMEVESYTSVHQLVSAVRGRLREGIGTIDALRALFPAGSMTGAPKLRTMQVIEAVEATPRGVYSGAFGWIAPDGRADLAVIIRSLTTTGDGTWTLGTGGGITVKSDVEEEYAEATWKAERLLRALGSGP